ncbi:hypothetical protein F4801DRAFT_292257 [Xylaria longipes]|nr:hypothetical protein F4801DRAFT_292257 [Xylaria longipes]
MRVTFVRSFDSRWILSVRRGRPLLQGSFPAYTLHIIRKGLRTYLHTSIHTSIHPWIHPYIHPYIHTYIRTYIHPYIHTYIHPIPTCITYSHTYATYIPIQ